MNLILYDLCGRDPDLRFSPYCWRVKMALALKGVVFDSVPVPFTGVPGIENGATKTIPVINDAGVIVVDSFEIALYLDRTRSDAPPLLEGGSAAATARFLEAWAAQAPHPVILRIILKDVHDALAPADQAYFRSSREARFGHTLEEHQTGLAANAGALAGSLEPARRALQRYAWLGGTAPDFHDCILFGSLMWLAIIAGRVPLAADDEVAQWFGRCRALVPGAG